MAEDFGDFGFANNDDFGKGGPAERPKLAAEKPSPMHRKRSTRNMGLYAKSPQQRLIEAQQEAELEEQMRSAQDDDASGFGSGGGMPSPPAMGQAGGFQLWGAPSGGGGMGGIVIPPFVPRDQRNKTTWDVGKMKKKDSDGALMAGSKGDFLIRETAKGDRHVVCVKDQNSVYESYIRHVDGGFMFSSRQFDTLAEVVKHLQRNPLYNRSGLPLYIDKPCKVPN